jgi:hypothetical protein
MLHRPNLFLGTATWQCDNAGQYVPNGEPDMSQCKGQWTEDLITQVSQLESRFMFRTFFEQNINFSILQEAMFYSTAKFLLFLI